MGRAEGGAKIFGVFRVKNHDFTGAPPAGSAPAGHEGDGGWEIVDEHKSLIATLLIDEQ